MKIGILGGSGLYEIEGFEVVEHLSVQTPYGVPSDSITHARCAGHDIFFLPRHGRGHRILPSEINHRGNIMAFKQLGVERILSVSAVGSLREDWKPGDVALPTQYFDRTKRSLEHTFFGGGAVGHISFGDPVCELWRQQVMQVACAIVTDASNAHSVHDGGVYVNMEGPAFSTRAESETYRKLGFDLIGMTSLGEAKLSREAGLCYCCLAMVTDYDCWHTSEDEVSAEGVLKTLLENVSTAMVILKQLIEQLAPFECACNHALDNAVVTAAENVPYERRRALNALLDWM